MIPATMSSGKRLIGPGLILLAGLTAIAGAVEVPGPVTRPSVVGSMKAASQPADAVIDRIRDQGLNHSQVMATLDTLCNVIGPRLTASPGQVRASEWTRDQLGRWGLSDAHLEPWGKFGRGWSVKRFELETVEPTAVDLVAVPKAWSPGVDGPVEADAVYLDARSASELEKYKGKLHGKVVLVGSPRPITAHFDPQARRMDDAELTKLADARSGADIGVSELMRWRRRRGRPRGSRLLRSSQPAGHLRLAALGLARGRLRRPRWHLRLKKARCWCWTPAIKAMAGRCMWPRPVCPGLIFLQPHKQQPRRPTRGPGGWRH